MANVLLINPSYESSYGGTKVGIINPIHPTLGLATIAAVARQRGHNVEVLDMCWQPYDYNIVRERVKKFQHILGIREKLECKLLSERTIHIKRS